MVDDGFERSSSIRQTADVPSDVSGRVGLISAELREDRHFDTVRKTFRPLHGGPHGQSSRAPDHWAHWRRELVACRSETLPGGPGLRAPRLLGVDVDTLYVEYVGENRPVVEEAAFELGRWHSRDHSRHQPWHVHDQLAQRLAVSDLDWSAVDIAPGLATLTTSASAIARPSSLIGASRAHWMATRAMPLPAGYVDFVESHRP